MIANRSRFVRNGCLALAVVVLGSSCSSDDTTDHARSDASVKRAVAQASGTEAAGSSPADVRFRMSRATTYITEPLDKFGYPDYVAAYNAIVGEGVTTSNNAAVPLLRMLGPGTLSEKERAPILDNLGLDDLPADGSYFVTWGDFVAEHVKDKTEAQSMREEMDRQFYYTQYGPWTADEAPFVMDWIAANETPLKLADTASRRDRFFLPIVVHSDQESFVSARPREALGKVRDVTRLLISRSHLRLASGQVEAAWNDLLTCFRLARMCSRGRDTVAWLIGGALNASATQGAMTLAQHAELTVEQARQFRADLDALPPLFSLSEIFEIEQRFEQLDLVVTMTKYAHGEMELPKMFDFPVLTAAQHAGVPVDFEETLRLANLHVDKQIELLRVTPRHERLRAARQMDDERDALTERLFPSEDEQSSEDSIKEMVGQLKQVIEKGSVDGTVWAEMKKRKRDRIVSQLKSLDTPQHRGAYLAELLKSANFTIPLGVVVGADIRGEAAMRTTHLNLALAAYRSQRGTSPETLAKLVPAYIAAVPRDPFTGASFAYRRYGGDYILKSTGKDGKFEPEDPDYPEDVGDDMVIRTVGSREAALNMIEKWEGTYDPERLAVDLRNTDVCDYELQYVTGLPEIEILNVAGTYVQGDCFRHLRPLKQLKDIDLSNTGVTEDGVSALVLFTQLEELSLRSTEIADNELECFGKLTRLKKLDLTETDIGDDGVKLLQSMNSLKHLDLFGTLITDDSIEHLSKLRNLKVLNVASTNVSPEGGERLQEALPSTFVIHSQ